MMTDNGAISDGNNASITLEEMQKQHTQNPAGELETNKMPPFKPGLRFYLAFDSLCVIILSAALDATALSVALPVRSANSDNDCISYLSR